MNKSLLIANGIGLMLIAGFLGYAIYVKAPAPEITESPDANDTQMIDGAEVTFSEEFDESSSENIPGVYETKVLLSQKYKKRPDEVKVNVANSDEHHIRANVVIGSGGPENTGIAFSSDSNGEWELVWDGNGVIPCAVLTEYDFPENMKWDCFEE